MATKETIDALMAALKIMTDKERRQYQKNRAQQKGKQWKRMSKKY